MFPRITTRCLPAAALALASTLACAATTTVEYVNPEKFTDAGRARSYGELESNLGQLKDHMIERGGKLLPADQKLSVTITDVDLAGAYDPRQRISNEVRVVKEIYPPRIELTFKLEGADGTVLKEGSRSLRDMNFMQGNLRYKGEALGYEKELIDDWLRKEFPKPKKP
jgi:hypothetical protein